MSRMRCHSCLENHARLLKMPAGHHVMTCTRCSASMRGDDPAALREKWTGALMAAIATAGLESAFRRALKVDFS